MVYLLTANSDIINNTNNLWVHLYTYLFNELEKILYLTTFQNNLYTVGILVYNSFQPAKKVKCFICLHILTIL